MNSKKGRNRLAFAAAFMSAGLILAGCSSDSGTEETTAAETSMAEETVAEETVAEESAAEETVQVAYLSFAVANTYDEPMLAAAEAVAAGQNAEVTVFDAANDPEKQYTQLQDAISSGQYQAIIVQPINGAGLISEVERAISEGIQVVVLDQIMGPDLSTDQPQVEGLAANVVFVPTEIGVNLGTVTAEACANIDPCQVGYIYAVKVSALDTAVRDGFDQGISGSTAQVVAEGENFFTVEGGLTAAQDMLQKYPDLNVIVGSDQGIIGAEQAVVAAGADTILIGYGGSQVGLQAIAEGRWYGGVMQAPADEGRIAMEAAIAAVRTGTMLGASNPLADLPNGGVINQSNVADFTAQWNG